MADTRKSKPEPPKTLSFEQIKLCNMLADPEERVMTKSDIAKKIGVTRRTIYNWLEREDVWAYRDALIDYYTDGEYGTAWKSLIKSVKKGNVTAIKLYFELKQRYVPPHQVTELKMQDATANINIVTNIPRPKEESKDDSDEED
jgi:predicted transcriptional regulator